MILTARAYVGERAMHLTILLEIAIRCTSTRSTTATPVSQRRASAKDCLVFAWDRSLSTATQRQMRLLNGYDKGSQANPVLARYISLCRLHECRKADRDARSGIVRLSCRREEPTPAPLLAAGRIVRGRLIIRS